MRLLLSLVAAAGALGCEYDGHDFSSVGAAGPFKASFPNDDGTQSLITLGFCAPITCVPGAGWDTPAASVGSANSNFPDECSPLGSFESAGATWTKSGDNFGADLKNGALFGCAAARETVITFKCGEADENVISAYAETAACVYSLTFNLDAATCGGGMSGGTIFLIIFLVGLIVFFAGGIAFKRFKMGATNMKESVPLIDFWVTLPGLVKDGFWFVFKQKCKKGGGGYEEVA